MSTNVDSGALRPTTRPEDDGTVAPPVAGEAPTFTPRPPGQRKVVVQRTNQVIASYSVLLKQVRAEGLLGRRRGFYAGVALVLGLGLTAASTGFLLLGDSWFQLIIAGVLGIILTQFAFLGHEASHRQIFASRRTNDRVGRVLAAGVAGISYAWWMDKHTRHHNDPNTVGRDPDIAMGTLSFREEDAAPRTGFHAWFTRRQGYLFFPLLSLEGVNLHVQSLGILLRRGKVQGRWLELALIASRFGLYLGVLFWFLPVGLATAFLGVQLAVFGTYMGASFAPNHKGMPILPAGSTADFLRRQVVTARNIRGGSFVNNAFGGLNFQIEHHLFPDMSRPHLRRAAVVVREHCATLGIPYTEVGVLQSYSAVIAHLNKVGLAARDPFDCPLIQRYRR
ncbi:acyl-CoA desaturase [Arthrobacter echini]|uniref:Acyl-CoA desaturase n=1 Tax=Arthrobacter echini TaxID=1529066 RepID=A0A4S5EAM0_9MICC|nr:acyl-CoA desaturase [Arthrobacter echini]THJ68643.1 acyl-CoA desaturase [Arthrobacter echini]